MPITLESVAELKKKNADKRKKLDAEDAALLVVENMLLEAAPVITQGQIDFEGLNVGKREAKESLTTQINDIVIRFGSYEFCVDHVEKALEKAGIAVKGKTPRARIANTLGILRKKGVIVRTVTGRGSDPHMFRLANTNMRLVKNED